ncbi:MAG: response regulator transcription factor [Candidatus Binataceae bacterium]
MKPGLGNSRIRHRLSDHIWLSRWLYEPDASTRQTVSKRPQDCAEQFVHHAVTPCFVTGSPWPRRPKPGLSGLLQGENVMKQARGPVLSRSMRGFHPGFESHQRIQRAENVAQIVRTAEEPGAPRTGVIVLSSEHRVLVRTEPANALLHQYFSEPRSDRELPDRLIDWLSQFQGTPAVNQEMIIERADRRLMVNLVAERSLIILILAEQSRPLSPESLRGLGLTTREAQVMNFVVQGKTNWEIAQILEMSRRTVDKHMEHILENLAAENRTTAIRIAMEHCGLSV